jgi:flagella basal body P-ring formation protein FlgA
MDTVGPVQVVDGTTVVAKPVETVAPPKPYLALVHYGDRVRLWRTEKNVRIEMSAIAEGSAAAGEEVKLRIPSSGVDGDTGWRVVGVVHGPGDVEMTQ